VRMFIDEVVGKPSSMLLASSNSPICARLEFQVGHVVVQLTNRARRSTGSRCRVYFVPSRVTPELLNHFSVDKLYDLLHCLSRCGCTGIPLDETFGLALEECELYLTACLAVVLDEAVDVGAGMS
jgi:hypothetical protein